jgi:predicted nucleotidyltransferase component of viral defense system
VNQVYLDRARLLTRVAPLVLVDDTFALKGGTAINLFVRDMPRLSVDLDLVFPDHTLPREAALRRINESVRQSVARLKKQGFQTHAPASADAGETKLLVRQGAIEVKVEVNFVMRGTVNPVRMASLTQSARDTLQADLEVPVVSLEDVYGGKLVAAMDRQHPRDCSMSCSPSRTRGSPPAFAAPSLSISPAITGLCMRCCFRRRGRSVTSSSTISQA